MSADEEGFLYPVVDVDRCIECNQCVKVCPELNPKEEISFPQKGFVVQNKDSKILRESTSGGAFTAIAQWILLHQGVVFGVVFDSVFKVVHACIDSIEELYRFRNSKYVQSAVGDSFHKVKEYLQKGQLVLFSGTPCQIEGLRHFLKKDYPNLYLLDIVCRAVPSPMLWSKYLVWVHSKAKDEPFEQIRFRDKIYGYNYSNMTFYGEKEHRLLYKGGLDSDVFLRAFFSNLADRPSCYVCPFKKRYRVGDFTLWDCFDPEVFTKEMNNNKGVTRVLLHTQKAVQLFEEIKNDFLYQEVDADLLVKNVKEMFCSVNEPKNRSKFFKDLHQMNFELFTQKYFKVGPNEKLERVMRLLGAKLNIYPILRKCAHLLHLTK
jgi:ferredoxin